MKKTFDVCGVGNALIDIISRVEDSDLAALRLQKGIMHLVSPETQAALKAFVDQRPIDLEIGGDCPNVIRTLALLGRNVSLAGLVADDPFGRTYIKRLNELGITNRVGVVGHGETGTSIILITKDGERTMNTFLGVSREYARKHIPAEDVRDARYFFVSGYQWDTPSQIDSVHYALGVAKEYETKIAFDVADPFCVKRHREAFIAMIQEHADIVFANREESHALLGLEPAEAIDRLATWCEIAVIKLGKEGALVKSGDRLVHVKPNAVRVLDTTGAGDMFAGGFLHGLLSGLDIDGAGRIAALCSEQAIQQIGAKLPEDIAKIVAAN